MDCVRLIKHNNDSSLTFYDLVNQPGSDSEYRRALSFVTTNNQYSNKFTENRGGIYSLDEINRQLFEWSRPIAIAITDSFSGHAIAIKGIHYSAGKVFISDPWNNTLYNANPDNMVGEAVERSVLYDDLVTNGYIPGTDPRTYDMTIEQNY